MEEKISKIQNASSLAELDRKILADIAVNDPESFKKIVAEVK